MLVFLKEYLKNKLLKLRIQTHKKYLNSSCTFGKQFCKSPMYSGEDQLLNVKVKNLTNDKLKIKFGDYCNMSISIFLNKNGSIKFGDYVYATAVSLRIDYNLKVGSNVMFGPNVKLWDTKSHPLSASKRHKQCEHIAHFGLIDSYEAGGGDIIIGDDVWIGMDCTILGGVEIGEGSVIAAGSIVTKNVPSNVLYAGIPARLIKSII
jgi:acetyltransferase-like isoleucine patch superfamily enzyme